MRLTLPAALIGIALWSGCGDAFGPPAFDWSQGSAMPVPRVDFVAVALGGKIYALGGFSGSTLARVDEYDPATNTWTRRADMGTARRNFVAGVVGGKIYVSAGMSWTDPNGVTYLRATEEYDPATNTWTPRADCPLTTPTNSVFGNSHHGGGAVGGRLYVLEFNTQINGFTATHEFDPASNTWAARAPVPFSYVQYSAAALDGQLYATASAGQFAAYDPSQNIWVIKSTLVTRGLASLVGADGRVFALGIVTQGTSGTPRASANIEAFDPGANRWSQAGRHQTARYLPGVVALGDRVYLIGGGTSPDLFNMQPLASMEVGVVR